MDDPDGGGPGAIPSFRQLKLFETVGRLQSLRRASEECCLSQPAVTHAIAKLEEQLGVGLLERRARGSYLNEYGIILFRRAERLFARVEEALTDLGMHSSQSMGSRITRSQIRSLISIVENGSFMQAAHALGVSQASLHRAARELEQNLRKPLYHRTAGGMIANPAGVELARRLKLATREIEAGIEELHEAKGQLGGRISIGVLQLSGTLLLSAALHQFVTEHPNARMRISNGNFEFLLRSLRAGDVDLILGVLENVHEDLVHESLVEAPYVIVARQGHPLLRSRRTITLDELAACEWMIGKPGATRRTCFDRLFAGRKPPRSLIETYSLPIIRALLSRSDRLALLTSLEFKHEEGALAALPFGPIEPAPSIGVTVRRDWMPTKLQAGFLEHLRNCKAGLPVPTKELLRAS